MRRFWMVLLCCAMLCGTVLGANEADSVKTQATVSSDGSCQVTLVASIRMETAVEGLRFPLPGNASGITLNGAPVSAPREGNVRLVNLQSVFGTGPWESTLTFRYSLDNAVAMDAEGRAMLELPILCGFAFPVETMEFSVAFPGEITARPAFRSGYHQESIESSMLCTVEGGRISGEMLEPLLDRETLTMTVEVPLALVSGVAATDENNPLFFLAMGGFALLALLYWLIFLRSPILRRIHRTTPPEGITAGAVRSHLVGSGTDLSLMVLTWAQLGYLDIDWKRTGQIFLNKRMPMGNERSAQERQCFRALFGQRRCVDGTGDHYAYVCRQLADKPAGRKGQYRKGSGNPRLLRLLCCGVGASAGAAMGIRLGGTMVWRMILAAVLGLCCAVASWRIQAGYQNPRLRDRLPVRISVGCCCGMILLGALTGTLFPALAAVAVQLLGGIAAAYGGRRTEAARKTVGELRGLRHYMKTVSAQELQRILRNNPNYYYELAPYALALGVDRAFAWRFGRQHLPACPYLPTRKPASTALEGYLQLRKIVSKLDAQEKRMKRGRLRF